MKMDSKVKTHWTFNQWTKFYQDVPIKWESRSKRFENLICFPKLDEFKRVYLKQIFY